jgi:hypothetical protein
MRLTRFIAVLTVPGMLLALAAPSRADHLPAPTGVTCAVVDGAIAADWDDVDGATKYSVGIVAAFDTDGDDAADVTIDFDFGTSNRTDLAPMSQSDLMIPLAALTTPFDTDGDPLTDAVLLDPISAQLRVKALHPGKGKGSQSHPFSAFCEVALP